ncbi:MAG: branched-chain amino acid ABC transporter permease [Rhizobiaceae bacterium]
MDYFFQIMANGLHNGALYALLAYGYVLTGIVTKRPNLAHGAVFAFSGQILVLAATAGYNALWMTLPAAILFGIGVSATLCAILLWTLATRIMPPFLNRAPNGMIVATLAIAIILAEAARIGADTRDFWLPPLLNSPIGLLPYKGTPAITVLQGLNIAAILLLIAGTQLALARTMAGRKLRAVADDPLAAAALGTNPLRVTQSAIISGGALAAIGGMLAVLYFGNMSFGSGLIYALKVLFIASAGGFSSPLAAALGAFIYGEAEALWDGYMPSVWRDAVFFSVLAFILILKRENRLTAP